MEEVARFGTAPGSGLQQSTPRGFRGQKMTLAIHPWALATENRGPVFRLSHYFASYMSPQIISPRELERLGV